MPIPFAQLVEGGLDEAYVRVALAELIARKQSGEELAVAPPVEALNEPDDAVGDVDELNGFFLRYGLAP